MADGAFVAAPLQMGTPEILCLFLRKLFSRYVAALFTDYDVAPSHHANFLSLFLPLSLDILHFMSTGANAELPPLLFCAAFDSVI